MTAASAIFFLSIARTQWFITDDFDYFLPDDGRSTLGWFIEPHNEHTIVFTKMWFGLLGKAFGLDRYAAYAAPMILAHCMVGIAAYRLVWVATASRLLASTGAAMVFAMGAAAGTLTWAGQFQYVGCVAAGLVLINVAVSRVSNWSLTAVLMGTVFGTLNGSSFLPLGLATAAVFAVRRHWVLAVAAGLPPVLWAGLERVIWHVDNEYAPQSLEQIFAKSSTFAYTMLDTAVAATLRATGLTAAVIVAVVVGALALASTPRSRTLTASSRVVSGALAAAIAFMTLVLIAGRLNRTTADLSVGGYSYLFLATLLPLAVVLLAHAVRGTGWGSVGAALLMSFVAGMGVTSLTEQAADLSDWKLAGRDLLQAGAGGLLASVPAYPEEVVAPATAPTVTVERLVAWSRSGFISSTAASASQREQLSLTMQWRLSHVDSLEGRCRDIGPGASVIVSAAQRLTIAARSPGTLPALTYDGVPGSKPLDVTQLPGRVDSLVQRSAVLSPGAGTINVCGG